MCHTRHLATPQGLSVRLHREGDQGAPPPGPPPCRELGAALGHQGAPPPGPPPCRELRGPPPCLCAGRAAAGCERRLALRARRRWRRRCTPGRLGQPNCCHALRARRRRPARPGACMCCPPMQCACASWGGGDVEDVVRCALLETLCERRASSSCRGRGWGGTPRGPHCHRRRHARAERRHGGSRHDGGARAASPQRQGLARPARRSRAAGALWEARARAARF